MKIPTLAGLLLAAAGLALAGCSTTKTTGIRSEGDNTYTITRESLTGFSRDTDSLKAACMADAQKFCAEHGKVMKLTDLAERKPKFWTNDFAKVTITFEALNPGDPELAVPAPSLQNPGTQAASHGDFYEDLIKLDDLHRRGIITDEEYQAEKKKILDRM